MRASRGAGLVLALSLALLVAATLWVTMSWAAPGATPLAQNGGAPTVVSYQGEVRVGDVPYEGSGYFKFAVVNATGDTSYWSNDGSSSGSEPGTAVQLAVSQGLFGVLLGDTTLAGMTETLTADVFSGPDRYLRVWFSSDGSSFSQLEPDTRIAAVPYALQAQEAKDADTVDGLHASELRTSYQNAVIVAKSGGDYATIQAAIDSISNASATNPYLVWVAPGVYSETVTLKPYVHLQGAGQEATVISSTASNPSLPPSQATLKLAHNTSLRDLTVHNGGTGDRNVALLALAGTTGTLVADVTVWAQGNSIFNSAVYVAGGGTSVTLRHVTALGENASSNNFGLYNCDGAATTLQGGSYTGRGGSNAYGLRNQGSDTTLKAQDVTGLAEDGGHNYGLHNRGAAVATLHGGAFAAHGGTEARGILNTGSGTTLEAEDVTALGERGSSINFGLGNSSGAAATLHSGSYTARRGSSARGIFNTDSGTTLQAQGVTALASHGSNDNSGLYNNDDAEAVLRSGSYVGRRGTYSRGIYNAYGAMLEAESVTALGETGAHSFGFYCYSAPAVLNGGSFTGRGGFGAVGIYSSSGSFALKANSITALGEGGSSTNYSLHENGGKVYLAASQLDGNAYRNAGTLKCFQVYDGDYNAYTCP